MPGVLIILGIAAVVAFIIWRSKVNAEHERIRRAGLLAFSGQNGMSFSEGDPLGLDGRYNGVEEIGRGHDRHAFDVLSRPGSSLVAFQYHYKTWETRTVTRNGSTYTEQYEETHWAKYLIIELGGRFPSLTLRSENFFDKLKGMAGFGDINFESEEFSRKYFCKSDNKEFAYAIIHPQMIEYLMNLGIQFHLQGGLLVMNLHAYTFDAAGVANAINTIGGMINRIPDFVWQDYGHAPAMKIPPMNCTPAAVAPV